MSTRERSIPSRLGPSDGDGRVAAEAALAEMDGRARTEPRSMAELLRELSTESGDLVRQEVALAKAEMREKLGVFQRSMVSIGIGAALLLAALLTGLWALNTGLTSILTQMVDLDVAIWLAPTILTIALGFAGMTMIKGGSARIAHEGLAPRQTAETLRDDKAWIQTKVHEVKEGATHGR